MGSSNRANGARFPEYWFAAAGSVLCCGVLLLAGSATALADTGSGNDGGSASSGSSQTGGTSGGGTVGSGSTSGSGLSGGGDSTTTPPKSSGSTPSQDSEDTESDTGAESAGGTDSSESTPVDHEGSDAGTAPSDSDDDTAAGEDEDTGTSETPVVDDETGTTPVTEPTTEPTSPTTTVPEPSATDLSTRASSSDTSLAGSTTSSTTGDDTTAASTAAASASVDSSAATATPTVSDDKAAVTTPASTVIPVSAQPQSAIPVVQFVANAVTAVVSVPVSAGLCALQVLAALAQWAVAAQFQLAAQIIASLSYGEVSELATSLLNPDGRIGLGSMLGLTPAAVSAALLPAGIPLTMVPAGLLTVDAVTGLPITAGELGRIAGSSVDLALSLPLVQSVTPTSLSVMGRSFLNWSGVQQLVAGFSLHALIAVVLLGLAGLFSLTGLGVRIGYVQAKASLRLQAAGLARFAGPIGVVSSGTMVTVHRRSARRTAGAPRLVLCRDEVA